MCSCCPLVCVAFKIEAVDTDPDRRAVAAVTVTLEDENDNSPSFTSDLYNGHVFANQSVGMFLLQVSFILQFLLH